MKNYVMVVMFYIYQILIFTPTVTDLNHDSTFSELHTIKYE